MNILSKFTILLAFVILSQMSAFARDFSYTYEGQTLTYTVLDEDAKTCETKSGTKDVPGNYVSGEVVIPSTATDESGNTYTVTTIGDYSFYNCTNLTGPFIIPNTVTLIGNCAFGGCSKLTEINLPNGLKTLGGALFSDCSSLTAIEIPTTVTSIGGNAFINCSKLTEINLPDGLKTIEEGIFEGCSSLTAINIPSSVNSIGWRAFCECSQLKAINLPEGLKRIEGYAFTRCSSLTSIIFPASVTYIGAFAFVACRIDNIIIFSDNIEFGKYPFDNDFAIIFCSESVDVTAITQNVNKIVRFNPDGASMLEDGTLLTDNGKTQLYAPVKEGANYVIPDGVTTIAESAFAHYDYTGMLELGSLTIPTSVEVIAPDVFKNIKWERVNFTDWSKWYATAQLGNLYSNPYWNSTPYAGGVKITTPEFTPGQTAIPDYINAGLQFKDEVDLPTTIKRIGAYAFYNNTELYSVILPTGLEEIGESAFEGCSLLENPSFPAGLKKIEDGAYKGCTSITEITLPEGLTILGEISSDNYTNTKGAFQYCTALERAVLVADIDYLDDNLFAGCTSLEKVFFPLQLKTIGAFSFYETALDEVTFPTTLETIGEYAFAKGTGAYSTPGITSLTIPNNVTTIGNYAFLYQRISNLTLGNGLRSIAPGAFVNNNLKIINFSDGLTEIGEFAFGNSKGLISEVNIPATVTSIAQNAFANTAICEMTVPDNVVSLPAGSCGAPSTLTIGTGIKDIDANAFSFDKLYTLRVKALTPPALSNAFPMTTEQNDQVTLIVNKDRKKNYETNARWKQFDRIIEDGQSEVVIYMTGAPLAEEIRMTSGLMPSSVTKMKVVGSLTANDLSIIKENMKALISLDMSGVTGVKAIPRNQFSGSLLTDIILPAGLEEIGANAFANCGLLQIETLPATLKTIGDNAFSGSPRVNISELPAALETIGSYAFSSTGIQQLIGNSSLKELGSGAFSNCSLLESVDFSKSALTAIPNGAFSGCSELDEVSLPQGIAQIGSNAFSGTALRNIDFMEGVITIGNGAFSNNRRLVAATLPKNVKKVESNIFSDCPRLLAVSMPSNTAEVGSNILNSDKKLTSISCAAIDAPAAESSAFDGLRMRYVSLIVPAQSFRSYLNTPVWGKFESIRNQIIVELDNGIDVSAVAED